MNELNDPLAIDSPVSSLHLSNRFFDLFFRLLVHFEEKETDDIFFDSSINSVKPLLRLNDFVSEVADVELNHSINHSF